MNARKPQLEVLGALLSTLLVWGAATARAETSDEGHEGQQGTHVHGTVEPFEEVDLRLNDAQLNGELFSWVQIDQGQLVGEVTGKLLKGNQFIGVDFSTIVDGQPVTFTISNAHEHSNVFTRVLSSSVWEYQVTWRWQGKEGSLCPGDTPALALPGRWSQGVYLPNDGMSPFFFACLPYQADRTDEELGLWTGGGVAAKCVDWGYAPWMSRDPMTYGGDSPAASSSEAARYHTSCVAMATADYCGQSMPNTVAGTPIVMFNNTNVRAQPGEKYVAGGPFGRNASSFEAAWTAAPGRDPDGHEGWRARAQCLTKKRWSTLPFEGLCPMVMPDPRSGRGQDCEDMTLEELTSQGPTLFSYSSYADAGLYRFKHKSIPGRFLTTAAVSIDPSLSYPASYRPTVAGGDQYVLDDQGNTPAFEGTILSPDAPIWFPGRADANQLQLLGDGLGNYVTLAEGMAPPPGYSSTPIVEGYVYKAKPDTNPLELNVWVGPQGYVTTTADLGMSGYGYYNSLGYTMQLAP